MVYNSIVALVDPAQSSLIVTVVLRNSELFASFSKESSEFRKTAVTIRRLCAGSTSATIELQTNLKTSEFGLFCQKELAVYKPYFFRIERLKIRLLHTYVVSGFRHMAHTVPKKFLGPQLS